MGGSTHTTSRLLHAVAWLDEDDETVSGRNYVLVHGVPSSDPSRSKLCILCLSAILFFIYVLIVMPIGEMCAGSSQR